MSIIPCEAHQFLIQIALRLSNITRLLEVLISLKILEYTVRANKSCFHVAVNCSHVAHEYWAMLNSIMGLICKVTRLGHNEVTLTGPHYNSS
ncbi:hypothetical protein VNO77_04556 [Canavalia gladiata]|uniref:Uncharacterized protein n=1 Tax=Canavalia gladiata TaxID=3824 RepID=A0AAN9MXD5_CANGL